MAENEELRQEMETYLTEHDIPHLFERLAASIMYDRPDDLFRYAGEWLLRLNVGVEPPSTSENAPAKTSEDQQPRKSGSWSSSRDSKIAVQSNSKKSLTSKGSLASLDPGGDKLSVALDESQRVSIPESKTSDTALVATAQSGKDVPHDQPLTPPDGPVTDANADGRNEFDPYLFTPENIAIFYGMMDPLNDGSILLEHFREVSVLMGVEKYIPWDEIRGDQIQRETFIDMLSLALKRDTETLRMNCLEKPKDALMFADHDDHETTEEATGGELNVVESKPEVDSEEPTPIQEEPDHEGVVQADGSSEGRPEGDPVSENDTVDDEGAED